MSASSQIIIPYFGLNYGGDNESDIIFENKPDVRAVFGVGTEIQLAPAWDFVPSVLFSIKGGKHIRNGEVRYRDNGAYLAFPLIVDYNIGVLGLNVGVVPSYWISERTKFYNGGSTQITKLDFNNAGITSIGHYNRLELAIEAGLRWSFILPGSMTLNFYLSYKYAVTPKFQPDSPQTNYNYLYNRWLQFKIGIPIKLDT